METPTYSPAIKKKEKRFAISVSLALSAFTTVTAITLVSPRFIDSPRTYEFGRLISAFGFLGLGVGVLVDGLIEGTAHGGDNGLVIAAIAIPLNALIYFCIFWGALRVSARVLR